jgi:hypothetical protein
VSVRRNTSAPVLRRPRGGHRCRGRARSAADRCAAGAVRRDGHARRRHRVSDRAAEGSRIEGSRVKAGLHCASSILRRTTGCRTQIADACAGGSVCRTGRSTGTGATALCLQGRRVVDEA